MIHTKVITERKRTAIVASSFLTMMQMEELSLQLKEVILLRRTFDSIDIEELIELKPNIVYVDNLAKAKKHGLLSLLLNHSIKTQEIQINLEN